MLSYFSLDKFSCVIEQTSARVPKLFLCLLNGSRRSQGVIPWAMSSPKAAWTGECRKKTFQRVKAIFDSPYSFTCLCKQIFFISLISKGGNSISYVFSPLIACRRVLCPQVVLERKRNEGGGRGETRNWKLRSRKKRQVKMKRKGWRRKERRDESREGKELMAQIRLWIEAVCLSRTSQGSHSSRTLLLHHPQAWRSNSRQEMPLPTPPIFPWTLHSPYVVSSPDEERPPFLLPSIPEGLLLLRM